MSDLAKAIFDWFKQNEDPYTYNSDSDSLTIGVDGILDCQALATALTARLPDREWQPIETAPKGEYVLVTCMIRMADDSLVGPNVRTAERNIGSDQWYEEAADEPMDAQPTRWMPLPEPYHEQA